MYIMADSLCHIVGMNTTLQSNYTPIEKIKKSLGLVYIS